MRKSLAAESRPVDCRVSDRRTTENEMGENEDICGLCGLPGADKIPHPIHWPDEQVPDTDLVHAECEANECSRASALCNGKARDEFLRNC